MWESMLFIILLSIGLFRGFEFEILNCVKWTLYVVPKLQPQISTTLIVNRKKIVNFFMILSLIYSFDKLTWPKDLVGV